jgi:hypothetical protein
MRRRALWLIPVILCGALLLSYRFPFAYGKPDVTRHEAQFLGGAINMQIEWQSPSPVTLVKLSVANIQKEIKIDAYDNKRNPNGYAGEVNVTLNLDWISNQPLLYVIQLEDELRVKSSLVTGKVKNTGVQQPSIVMQPQPPTMQIQIQQNISQPGTQPGAATTSQPVGSLTVTINPQSVAQTGAMWRLSEGTWKRSGETISNLPVDIYTVEFQEVSNWVKPDNQKVFIEEGKNATLSGTYEK